MSSFKLIRRTQKLIQRMAGTAVQKSEFRERSGASSSKTSEGGVERDLFPALSGRGQGSRISIAAPLKEAVTIKITKANNIDSTFYHQKKLKMLTQTPKPSAQAVVWAMKQR